MGRVMRGRRRASVGRDVANMARPARRRKVATRCRDAVGPPPGRQAGGVPIHRPVKAPPVTATRDLSNLPNGNGAYAFPGGERLASARVCCWVRSSAYQESREGRFPRVRSLAERGSLLAHSPTYRAYEAREVRYWGHLGCPTRGASGPRPGFSATYSLCGTDEPMEASVAQNAIWSEVPMTKGSE
jgi:hypothetical protein